MWCLRWYRSGRVDVSEMDHAHSLQLASLPPALRDMCLPGNSPQASVSSSVIDGGTAAKLMAGSALYSGRDRAMVGFGCACGWVWMWAWGLGVGGASHVACTMRLEARV